MIIDKLTNKYDCFYKHKLIYIFVFLIYLFFVFYITIFNREPTYRRRVLTPLWEYHELFYGESLYWFKQIICNIIMFIPFGVLIGLNSRKLKIIHIIIISTSFSLLVELCQYYTKRGLLEFDDVFNNTFGAVIGFVFIKLTIVLMQYKRLSNKL